MGRSWNLWIRLGAVAALGELLMTIALFARPAAAPAHDHTPAAVERPVLSLRLEPLIAPETGLERPLWLTDPGDGSGRLFVVEQAGRVRIMRDGQLVARPFLDITSLVGSKGNEQGLLSIAFHPRFRENGLFFVDYTDLNGDTVVARYHVSSDLDIADPASAQQLLFIDQPAANHNGGLLLFGPDGYLYIGSGDGGSNGQRNAQRPDVLLGKILRIDVDHTAPGLPYAIPPDNPYAATRGARPEIWLTGLRNPWRFSFDRATGDLFIGDVGSVTYEEIDLVPRGAGGGGNFGWGMLEGPACTLGDLCDTLALADALHLVSPVAWYRHVDHSCSVTGGYVYRGDRVPALTGIYLFADYCSGRLWGMRHDTLGRWLVSDPLETGLRISSFGEDAAGELYVVDLQGSVWRVAGADR